MILLLIGCLIKAFFPAGYIAVYHIPFIQRTYSYELDKGAAFYRNALISVLVCSEILILTLWEMTS